MYSVLHYMWNQENYKATLLKLGEEVCRQVVIADCRQWFKVKLK